MSCPVCHDVVTTVTNTNVEVCVTCGTPLLARVVPLRHVIPTVFPEVERTFDIHIESNIALKINEIWPDGDAPENPTAEDVAEAMRDSGDKKRVLRDWELIDDLEVDVEGVRVWR